MNSRSLEWKEPNAEVTRRLVLAALVAIGALCTVLLVTDVHRIRTQNTGDFEHFYYAADAVRHHADPYAAWTRGYIYPPLIAFLFQPLSYLGRDRAAAVMLVVNVSVTLAAVALAADEFLRRFGGSRSLLAIVIVMLLALLMNIDKVKSEWQMWQTDVFMLLLFVLALRWLDRRPIAAGVMLGIAINIKYLPLLFLPYLLIRRRWTTAGSLVVSTIAFALLPAISTGWGENIRNWGTATNGLVQMTGAPTNSPGAAEIHGVTDSLSCSITSAFARSTPQPRLGFLFAGAVAAVAFGVSWWIYRWWNLPMFQPIEGRAAGDAVTGVEWVMLLSAILAFSPQTNTRHLFDALLLTTAASVLLMFVGWRRGFGGEESGSSEYLRNRRHVQPNVPQLFLSRLPLLFGITLLVMGFVLPPGRRTRVGEHNATIEWLRHGGPCWCLLIAGMTVLWTGLACASGNRNKD